MPINTYYTNRTPAWVGRFNVLNEEDMKELQLVKQMVKFFNKNSEKHKWRLDLKGREQFNKTNPKYGWGGSLKGGLKNAKEIDVYIHKRAWVDTDINLTKAN